MGSEPVNGAMSPFVKPGERSGGGWGYFDHTDDATPIDVRYARHVLAKSDNWPCLRAETVSRLRYLADDPDVRLAYGPGLAEAVAEARAAIRARA